MSGPSGAAYSGAIVVAVVAVVLFGAWALYIGYIGLAYSLGASTFGVAPAAPQAGGAAASPATLLGVVLLVVGFLATVAIWRRGPSKGAR